LSTGQSEDELELPVVAGAAFAGAAAGVVLVESAPELFAGELLSVEPRESLR